MRRHLIAGALAFAAVTILLGIKAAQSHWQYEMHCCNRQDCHPVEDKIVTETSAGFQLNDGGEFVERSSPKVRKPLDENYHVCRNPAGALLCIYPKFQGN
jgi:hypothetical protein